MSEFNNRTDMLEFSKKSSEAIESAFEAAADVTVKGYKTIETGVFKSCKAVENAVVGNNTKIEDKFVDQFLKKEGETVEEAKQRLKTTKPQATSIH